jgi:hypothetical protein
VGGICGNERPGKGFVGDWPLIGRGAPAPPRAGRTGFGLPGGGSVGEKAAAMGPVGEDWSKLALFLLPPLSTTAGLTGLSWPVLKGLLETSLEGRTAAPLPPVLLSNCFSRPANGGSGGRWRATPLPVLVGLGLGGRLGGVGTSATGDILLTVAAEALEERESLEEVRLILEGLSGDRLVSRSSVELLLLTVILFSLEAMTLTLLAEEVEEVGPVTWWTGADTAVLIMLRSSSWELDLTRGGEEPN